MKLTGKWMTRLALLGLVLIALLLSLVRLGMHNLHLYSDLVESTLARALPGFRFAGAEGTMKLLNPVLSVDNAVFRLPDSEAEIKLEAVAIELSLWRSVLEMAPVVREVEGRVDGLQLRRHVSGNWLLNDFPLRAGANQSNVFTFQRALQLLPEYLDLRLSNIEVIDEIQAKRHRIEAITAFLHQEQQAFEVQLNLRLSETLGNGLLVKGRITEDTSLVHAQLSDLQLSPMMDLLPSQLDWTTEGQLSGVTWLEFDGRQLSELSGKLEVSDTMVTVGDYQPAKLDYRGSFRASRDSSAWLISNQVESLALNESILNTFNTELRLQQFDDSQTVSAWFDRMSLANLVAIQPWLPEAEITGQLSAANPTGLVQDVVVNYDSSRPADVLLSTNLLSLSSQRTGNIPAIENLSGSLLMHQGKATIRLQGQRARLDFGDFFTEPMFLQDYEVEAIADYSGSELVVSVPQIALANQDAVVEGRAWLTRDDYRRPLFYLRAEVLEGSAERVRAYLPATKIPAEVMRWLGGAVTDGDIVSADLLFHGRLTRISEWDENRSGGMQIEGEVRQVNLKFDPDWPALAQANGRVTFDNMQFFGELEQFNFGDNVNPETAQVLIANYKEPWLELNLAAELPAQQAVATWLGIPLSEPQRNVFEQFKNYSGRVSSDLSVSIPLKSALGDDKVDLQLSLLDVGAESDDLGVQLSELNGVLSIDEATISAEQLTGRFFGDEVSMKLVPDRQAKTIELIANGRLSSANLLRNLPDGMRTRVSGKSDWQVALLFPMTSGGATRPDLQVVAKTDLRGTRIDLPAPLGVSAVSQHAFTSRVQLFSRHLQYSVSVGEMAKFRGVMNRQGGLFTSQSLDIALQRGFKKGMQSGLRIYGQLPEFVSDQWLGIFSALPEGQGDFLQAVDLSVERADLFGYQMNDLVFWMQRDAGQLNGSIESPTISGVFQLPSEDRPDAPIVVELDRLVLTERDSLQDESAVKPTDIPNLDLSVRSLDVIGKQFDNVEVSIRKAESGVTIERANATQGQVRFSSAATWAYDEINDQHDTLVSLGINGSQVGRTMETLGFGNVISNGRIEFNGDFRWRAALTEFDLASFSGAADLTIRDGILNNVEPGAGGRLVGLLSISALPRRLSLDFKDMLVEGMEFEKISGTFRSAGEELLTRNTRLRGPTADIKISGTTGIVRRDYDQVMLVKPKLSASLPIIGTITAGSGIGWGLLLLHDLYKDAVNEAVQVEYRVTGSWDDPQITEVARPTEQQQPETTNDQDRR